MTMKSILGVLSVFKNFIFNPPMHVVSSKLFGHRFPMVDYHE